MAATISGWRGNTLRMEIGEKGIARAARSWTGECFSRVSVVGSPLLTAVGLWLAASPAFAWEGHTWEAWKQVASWTRPEATSEQAGRKELVPLLGPTDPGGKRIDEIKAWESRRSRYAAVLRGLMGEPSGLTPGPVEVRTLGKAVLDDHIRLHVLIRSEPDDWIPAYLLWPKELGKAPRPAIICLHQTVPQGKDEPCGIKGNPELAFALQLVRRGYVCIAPDAIGFGERIPPGASCYHDSIAFYRRHPGWSFMGKMTWDVSRVIDYLETLPFVDRLQIGSIGHSHGGYGTLMAAAFDTRITAAVVSCGVQTLRGDPNPERWSHLTALLPQIGTYLPEVASIPFDWHQVCAMVAPRSLFIWYATKDSIFPYTENLEAVGGDVRGVYGLYGAADDLTFQPYEGEHRLPQAGAVQVYEWLGERLFTIGDLRVAAGSVQEWEARRGLIQRVIRRTIGEARVPDVPFEMEVLSVEALPGYERRLIEYTVAPDERVRAYLCVPHGTAPPRPGMLVLHQTIEAGKRESVGLAGSPSLAFGADLAGRGYVTLSPDSICAGERIDSFGKFDTRGHYLRHPDLSAMGRMLFDARRALNLLASREEVDRTRLGVIGHSLGAEGALMLAAFNERVKATVASCGYATFAADAKRMCWARDSWFSYMPKLRPLFLAERLPHWDWDEVLRLIAPRALYQHTTRGDNIFPYSMSAYEAGERARAIWELYGRSDALANVLKEGKHEIADGTRVEMYEWLDMQLKDARKKGN